jgi:hypothetical protein
MARMKLRWKIVLAVVTPVVIGVATTPLWIDRVARATIDEEATKALGVECKLAGIKISIFGAACTMEGLTVANPKDFSADETFLKMGRGSLALNARSLLGDKVEIPVLTIEDLELNLERKGLNANYRAILKNLEKTSGGGPSEPSEPGKKFVIREVVLRNIKVRARVSAVGLVKPAATSTIEEIRFRDVGSDTGGAALATVVSRVITSLIAGVLRSGVALPKEIADGLGEGLKGVGGVGITGVKVGRKVVGDVGKGVVDGIGGLLGGKKKPEDDGCGEGKDE